MREATEDDAPELSRLLYDNPQVGGRAVLAQDRSRDPFARRAPYDHASTLAVERDGDLVATGSYATKTLRVGGDDATAAYVFDVAVDDGARGEGLAARLVRELERSASQAGAEVAYAHVLGGNDASTRLFESLGYDDPLVLDSRVYPVRGFGPPSTGGALSDWERAARLRSDAYGDRDLYRPLDAPALRDHWRSLPGYRADDVWAADDAVLGLWDYSEVAVSIPRRLPLEARLASGALRVARRLGSSAPALPAVGEAVRYGLLLGRAGDAEVLRELFRGALGRARERGLDVVVDAWDPRSPPPYVDEAFGLDSSYHLFTRSLDDGRVPGDRPVWVDPVDL